MQHEERFKQNLISLAQFIVDVNDDAVSRGIKIVDTSLLSVGVCLLEKISPKTIIDKFIDKSNGHWEKIRVHDQEYFETKALDFFAGIPEERISQMRVLLMGKDAAGKYYVPDNVRKTIWAYMDAFVKISLKYLSPDGRGALSPPVYLDYAMKWKIS